MTKLAITPQVRQTPEQVDALSSSAAKALNTLRVAAVGGACGFLLNDDFREGVSGAAMFVAGHALCTAPVVRSALEPPTALARKSWHTAQQHPLKAAGVVAVAWTIAALAVNDKQD